MLPRRWSSGFCVLAGLLAAVVIQPGCVVHDRVEIVPRDWSAQQADAGETLEPQTAGGRVGTNAVLPDPAPVAPDTTEPAVEPMPDVAPLPDAVADAGAEGDTDPAPVPTPEPDGSPDDDAIAQGGPDAAPDAEPDTPPAPEPDAPVVRALDPPLHEAWAQGSAYNRRYVAGSDPASASGEIEAVGTFVPAQGASPGLLLTLSSGDTNVAVHVAPLRYLRAVELRFDFGEPLTVTGRWVNLDGKRVLFAQSISRGETEIAVRDAQTGRPVWVDPLPPEDGAEEQDAPADQAAGDSPAA
ncbi:hypothetical protein OT109_07520 [Phycisphaeraceae bacterium D3-23]